jgi:hypothetical protein
VASPVTFGSARGSLLPDPSGLSALSLDHLVEQSARMKADVANRFKRSSGPGDDRTSGTEVCHQKTSA